MTVINPISLIKDIGIPDIVLNVVGDDKLIWIEENNNQ